MKLRLFLLIALTVAMMPINAQQRKATRTKAKATAKTVTKVRPATPAINLRLYHELLPATAKVLFVDSVVVPKHDFLQRVPLSDVTGTMVYRQADRAQYENAFSGRRYFAAGDSLRTMLWTQSLLGNGWSQPEQLKDISEETFLHQNYPFLAADGTTLYFSATGEESMGGRDIFMTSYNADKGSWFEPQNMGLPFNSTANDYLLAIDDIDTLGWLVTDRRQPADSVCIYTFVPTAVRQDFQADALTDKQIERYGRVLAISDTWAFGDRDAALRRRDAMVQRQQAQGRAANTYPTLVVNDQRVVTTPEALTMPESRRLYDQLREVAQLKHATEQSLEKLRAQYADSHAPALAATILAQEKNLRQQVADLNSLTQQIRRLENRQ